MSRPFSLQSVVRGGFAATFLAGVALPVAGAQTAAVPAAAEPASPLAVSAETAAVPNFAPGTFTLADTATPAFSSSVASDAYDPATAAQTQMASLEKSLALPGVNAMQYGQRRRYGAPRYRGGNTNADGSEKYTGYVGGGFASPVGTNSSYLTTSWGFQVGGGRNFNRHFGVNLEFAYDHFGMTGQTIDNQSYRYFADPTNSYGLDANSHIWSFSLQPVYQIYSGPGLGAYITGGVGFYHKVANFTLPQEEEFFDPYYGYGVYEANENVDHYTSNAPGFDGGIGLTYKFSRFSNERLYAEARYVFVDNSFRPGITNATAATYTGNNYFPENSNTTSYFPIKFGLRF